MTFACGGSASGVQRVTARWVENPSRRNSANTPHMDLRRACRKTCASCPLDAAGAGSSKGSDVLKPEVSLYAICIMSFLKEESHRILRFSRTVPVVEARLRTP